MNRLQSSRCVRRCIPMNRSPERLVQEESECWERIALVVATNKHYDHALLYTALPDVGTSYAPRVEKEEYCE